MDSPSRQLLEELRDRLRWSDEEFRRRLNEATAKQERDHQQALASAAAEHERIRQNAERTIERLAVEQQRARKLREEEELRELERARAELEAKERQEQAELEQRQLEQLRRSREDLERKRRLQEEQEALDKVRREEEARRVALQQEAEQRAAEDAAREASKRTEAAATPSQVAGAVPSTAPAVQPPAPPPVSPTVASKPGFTSSVAERDAQHKEYLDLHKRLKDFRKHMADLGKQDKAFKGKMGEGRREITKTVGQMNAGASEEVKRANRQRIAAVRTLLQQAWNQEQPHFDIRTFLAASRNIDVPAADAQISGLFIYLLNIFSKCVVKQYIGEAGISPEKAEPVGLLLANVFGQQIFQWHGTTYLIDVLLAKFHKVCPILFGIYGPGNTPQGRLRSGWLPGLSAQENSERLTGLGAGFASITLRDFSKSAAKNPLPVSILWRTLAMIVNTPSKEASDSHYLVLKALLDPVYVQKLIKFYGDVALAMIRKAVFDFPSHSNTVAANALKVLPDLYKRQLKLTLA